MKEQTKHTPGKWYIEYAETAVRWPLIVVKDDRYEEGIHQIAEVNDHVAKRIGNSLSNKWRKHKDADEAMANAKLIAAAPELFNIVNLLVRHGDDFPARLLSQDFIEQARAVLAKIDSSSAPSERGI